jgi:pyridoxal phosphate enzyme (YggS family)
MTELANRLRHIQEQVSESSRIHNREEPLLIVVTKNFPVDLPIELSTLGVRHFGENRVQEAMEKTQQFSSKISGNDHHWHLIGQLQTNKVKQALEFATSIHSLDRSSLLAELAKRTEERQTPLEVFIQVNLSDDPQRGGVDSTDLFRFANEVQGVTNLRLAGLMAVASLGVNPSFEFERVAKLSEKLQIEHPDAKSLSIGMSEDFPSAIAFGATHLRIGSAITGKRTI